MSKADSADKFGFWFWVIVVKSKHGDLGLSARWKCTRLEKPLTDTCDSVQGRANIILILRLVRGCDLEIWNVIGGARVQTLC